LETREFEQDVGLWPIDMQAGSTEFEVAHRPTARRGIVWPVDLIRPRGDAFVHIGTDRAIWEDSRQEAAVGS